MLPLSTSILLGFSLLTPVHGFATITANDLRTRGFAELLTHVSEDALVDFCDTPTAQEPYTIKLDNFLSPDDIEYDVRGPEVGALGDTMVWVESDEIFRGGTAMALFKPSETHPAYNANSTLVLQVRGRFLMEPMLWPLSFDLISFRIARDAESTGSEITVRGRNYDNSAFWGRPVTVGDDGWGLVKFTDWVGDDDIIKENFELDFRFTDKDTTFYIDDITVQLRCDSKRWNDCTSPK